MPDVKVVRGEMQPWSDYTGKRAATSGPVPKALLEDVLPVGGRALIAGPHGSDLVSVVLAKASSVTMLVRSVSDAETLAGEFGDRLQVVAGGLDGLQREPYDVVVAVDGLDRLLGYDSARLNWAERLDLLFTLATPEAVLVVGLENEFSLLNLLDRRPLGERHGDDEWLPLHDDPSRPVSPDQLAAALRGRMTGARVEPSTRRQSADAVAMFADYAGRALLSVGAASQSRPGELGTRVALAALENEDRPLLASAVEGTESAARAGLLGAVAAGWVAVCGGAAALEVYGQVGSEVLRAARCDGNWSVSVSGDAASVGEVWFDPAVVPAVVPGGVSVETVLFRLAAAEDVPGFRALAARLGAWVAADSAQLVRWDEVVMSGDGFAVAVSPWRSQRTERREDLLAAAWQRFHQRLHHGHRRHPWPPWMIGDDLVSTWLGMSGVPAAPPTPATAPDTPRASSVQVAHGKELATALDHALGHKAGPAPDLRSALAEAERAKQQAFELAGHVYGLERTLGFRDKALKTREHRIRELRSQLEQAKADRAKLHKSRAYALARTISQAAQYRHPRKLARALKRVTTNKLRRLTRR